MLMQIAFLLAVASLLLAAINYWLLTKRVERLERRASDLAAHVTLLDSRLSIGAAVAAADAATRLSTVRFDVTGGSADHNATRPAATGA